MTGKGHRQSDRVPRQALSMSRATLPAPMPELVPNEWKPLVTSKWRESASTCPFPHLGICLVFRGWMVVRGRHHKLGENIAWSWHHEKPANMRHHACRHTRGIKAGHRHGDIFAAHVSQTYLRPNSIIHRPPRPFSPVSNRLALPEAAQFPRCPSRSSLSFVRRLLPLIPVSFRRPLCPVSFPADDLTPSSGCQLW